MAKKYYNLRDRPVGIRRVRGYWSNWYHDYLLVSARHLGDKVSYGIANMRAQAKAKRAKASHPTHFAKQPNRRDRPRGQG